MKQYIRIVWDVPWTVFTEKKDKMDKGTLQRNGDKYMSTAIIEMNLIFADFIDVYM